MPFLDLVQGDERAVYADRGYDGWWYKAGLAERGIADGIMAGSYRQRPLDAEGRARNRAIAPLRAPIERRFAILKRGYGTGACAIGACCATRCGTALALALNLRRAPGAGQSGG